SQSNEIIQEVTKKLHFTQTEIDDMKLKCERMYLPYDASTKIYEQHEGFHDLPHIDIHSIPVEEFPLYSHWSYDRIYRNDMIKQPDVLMFLFLYNKSLYLQIKQSYITYNEY